MLDSLPTELITALLGYLDACAIKAVSGVSISFAIQRPLYDIS